MSKSPPWDPAGAFGFDVMNPDDEFQFVCTNCCECCRNVRSSVMVEPLDLFRIAKYTYRSIEEASQEFTDPVMLSWGFPILTLKTETFMDTCVFLKNCRCSIHDAKPRACRIYPLIARPDDTDIHSYISLMDTKRKNNHTCGPKHLVKDWMDKYFTDEDRRFIRADYQFAGEFAKMKNKISKDREDEVMRQMLLFRYFMYDLEGDFMRQFIWNMTVLKENLKRLCKNYKEENSQ